MNKRTLLFSIISLFFLLILGYVSHRLWVGVSAKKTLGQQLQTLPVFKATTLQNTIFEPTSKGKSVVLLLFNTECEHCQYKAQQLLAHQAQFKEVEVYLLSIENIETIQAFASKYDLDAFTLLHIEASELVKVFGAVSFPQVLVYDQQHKLLKQFKGETKMEAILGLLGK